VFLLGKSFLLFLLAGLCEIGGGYLGNGGAMALIGFMERRVRLCCFFMASCPRTSLLISASLISSIMNVTPTPVSSKNRRTPPALDYVVSTCLAKDCDELRNQLRH